MIELKHVSKVYESGAGQVHALRDVTFTLPSSGLVFVLGKSGCGKSTLLNLLGGMDSPTQGEIALNGTSIVTGRERDLDVYRNNCVGFVFQEFNLLEGYSAGANIALALQLKKQKADRAQVDAALRRVGLVDGDGNTLYERKISQLSGGQKQRVAVARALVKDPEIILADEPTGALDSETSASLFALLKELSQDKLIVVVTHDRESAERYGDRIIELHDGSVISDRRQDEAGAGGKACIGQKRGKGRASLGFRPAHGVVRLPQKDGAAGALRAARRHFSDRIRFFHVCVEYGHGHGRAQDFLR